MKHIKLNGPLISKLVIITLVASITFLVVFLSTGRELDNSTATVISNTGSIADIQVAEQPEQTDNDAVQMQATLQNDSLIFLIEEEKLAHDVYTVLHQIYGTQVFANILESEETHQSRVLTLLQARGISDPRSTELGVFNNTELQKLYDSLISQGKQSISDAFRVGVTIEEKDITDITNQLATATDSDIISALNSLRSGSENHLRAFNRQLSRY